MKMSWIKLEVEDKVNLIGDEKEGFKLFARRSDGVALFLLMEFTAPNIVGNDVEEFREELAKTLATLETFRNCECREKKPCSVHKGEDNEN